MNSIKIKNTLLILLGSVCLMACHQGPKAGNSLDFNSRNYKDESLNLNGQEILVRAFENIVYVANPVDTTYQIMNVYVPRKYFEGGIVNGYTAETAPVFLLNKIGGYMPAKPASADARDQLVVKQPDGETRPEGAPDGKRMGPPEGQMPSPPAGFGERSSTLLAALARGYVVVSPGARGRTTQDQSGFYTGKAPAALVDLKAAVRYLKYNDETMPGDANKIVSNGTSAGGAMSALLGATGNDSDYAPYLKALGAAPGKDDIFAAQCYCPITNLDHADMAYEWQFNGVNTYKGRIMPGEQSDSANTLSDGQISVSNDLKALFPEYVNSLQLKDNNGNVLTLDENGNGSFKEWVMSYVMASAQKALNSGADLSSYSWLQRDKGNVSGINFDQYVRDMQRQKTPPAFDALDLSSPENQEFGTMSVDKQHFTAYSSDHSKVEATTADQNIIRMMNPMDYIGHSQSTTAPHWRIRHGTNDKDTGLAIPLILGTYLQNKGYDVDLALAWDRPHSGDYDLDELFNWIDRISK